MYRLKPRVWRLSWTILTCREIAIRRDFLFIGQCGISNQQQQESKRIAYRVELSKARMAVGQRGLSEPVRRIASIATFSSSTRSIRVLIFPRRPEKMN